MAGSISNIHEASILTWSLGNPTAVVRPTAWYIGLFTDASSLTIDQPITEAVNNSSSCPNYARQQVSWTLNSSQAQNAVPVTFTASGLWVTVNYFGVFDALTNGNLLYWGSITGKILANTDQLRMDINQITITLD